MIEKIIQIIRNTKHPESLQNADSLAKDFPRTGMLHLRSLPLDLNQIAAISTILQQEKVANSSALKSISFSYNKHLGDGGATLITSSLPNSTREIGLVGCGIGDIGGKEVLQQIKKLPNLSMICIEQNNFSKELKQDFRNFSKSKPHILVVV